MILWKAFPDSGTIPCIQLIIYLAKGRWVIDAEGNWSIIQQALAPPSILNILHFPSSSDLVLCCWNQVLLVCECREHKDLLNKQNRKFTTWGKLCQSCWRVPKVLPAVIIQVFIFLSNLWKGKPFLPIPLQCKHCARVRLFTVQEWNSLWLRLFFKKCSSKVNQNPVSQCSADRIFLGWIGN